MHDYFTSALPAPQKGAAVSIALSSLAQVHARPDTHPTATDTGITFNLGTGGASGQGETIYLHRDTGSTGTLLGDLSVPHTPPTTPDTLTPNNL